MRCQSYRLDRLAWAHDGSLLSALLSFQYRLT